MAAQTTTQSLLWFAREFTITVLLSFLILSTLLETFFSSTAIASISPARLLVLVLACTSLIFTFLIAVLGVPHATVPVPVEVYQEPDNGTVRGEKSKSKSGEDMV